MHLLSLLLVIASGAPAVRAASTSPAVRADPDASAGARSTSPAVRAASTTAGADAAPPPENLLAGPARCVLRYLDAVRMAGPRPLPASATRLPAAEKDYAKAKRLTAPRTLEEIARRAADGEDHPLAPWRDAARARVLESFQLVAIRRAPQGAVVVTVKERFWRPGARLERTVSEYLVARVSAEWKVIDRSPGAPFADAEVPVRYAGFFDAAPEP